MQLTIESLQQQLPTTAKGRKVLVFTSTLACMSIIMLWQITVMFHNSSMLPSSKRRVAASESIRSSIPTNINHDSSEQPEPEGWHPIHVFYGNRSALLEGSKAGKTTWFSQVGQDQTIVDLLGNNGYFIDLAANDAKYLSNTLGLEKRGWNGLCIEPNPIYWYGLSHRKCTVVGALMGGKVERVKVSLRGAFGGIVGFMSDKEATRNKAADAPPEDRYTAPIREVFQQFHVPKVIDYMSLDVEGAEYLIMQNFPFEQYTVRLMTVERPSSQLKTLLEQHDYIFLKRLATWGETLWAHKSTGFTPESLQNRTAASATTTTTSAR